MKFLRGMTRSTSSAGLLAAMLFLLGTVVAVYLSVSRPLLELVTARQQTAALDAKIDNALQRARATWEQSLRRARAQKVADAQRTAPITGDPFAWIVREISLVAEHHPIRMLSIQPGATQAPGRVNFYTARLEVAGSYDQLGEFVRDVENKFPQSEIRSLEIVAGQSADDRRASLDLTLLTRADSPAEERNPS